MKYRITAPDGKQYDIEGDGTQEEALAHFQSQYAQMQQQPPAAPPTFGQRVGQMYSAIAPPAAKEIPDIVASLGSQAVGALGGGLNYLGTLGATQNPEAAKSVQQDTQKALSYQPRTVVGKAVSGVVNQVAPYVGQKEGEWAGNKVMDLTNSPMLATAANLGANVGTGAIAGGSFNRLVGMLPEAGPRPAPVQAQPSAPPTDLQQAAGVLAEHDIPTYRHQVSQNQTLQNAQAALDQLPFSGAKSATIKQGNAFNRAALSLAGSEEGAVRATPEVMGRLQDKLGANLDTVENNASFPVPDKQISTVLDDARLVLDDQQFGKLERQVQNINTRAAANGGELSGTQFASIKRSLDRLSKGQDTDVAGAARDLRSALQDGLEQALTPDEAAFYAKTRSQYQMMKQIEGAINNDGNISPSKLANVFRQKANRYQGIYGKGNQKLANLARAGAQILPEKVPNSGTAQRLAYTAILGGGLYTNPLATALAAGAGVTLPRLMRALPSGSPKPITPLLPP